MKLMDSIKTLIAGTCLITGLYLIGSGIADIINPPKQYQSNGDLPVLDLSDADQNAEDKLEPMIAIFRPDPQTKKMTFYCTAFVVSDKLALTAGHCLVDDSGYRLTKDAIQIKDDSWKDAGTAKAGAVNLRADLGVIVGDFTKFNKMPLSMDGFFGTQGPYATCGFPWGSEKGFCTLFEPQGNFYFEVGGKGALFPGQSGGPCIDLNSGAAVGLNTQVQERFVVVAPLTGIQGALELKIKGP